jgi:sec-independent protein translocase protein TatA
MELLIILLLVLLLFGAKKVPEMARSFGVSLKEFRRGLREAEAEEAAPAAGPLTPTAGSQEPA